MNVNAWGQRQLVFAACCLGLITVSGCGYEYDGPKRELFSGTVTREGIPVDDGAITFSPKGGGPAAQTAIKDGKYEFNDETTGPVAGAQDVTIIQHTRREEVPEGTPLKDADFIPEDRFKGKMPPKGWRLSADIAEGQADPINFTIEANTGMGRRR